MSDLYWMIPAGLVGLYVVAELLARFWLRVRKKYWILSPHMHMVLEVDRETLPALEPEVNIRVNADGERGDPPPVTWNGTWRGLVVGGSAAECYMLDQKSNWPQVVQDKLNESGKANMLGASRVHIGNVSRSLVACESLSRMLEKVLPRYERLDMVVLMVGASDVVAWLEKDTPPKLEPGSLPAGRIFAEHPEGPFGWMPRQMALKRIAARLNARFRHPVSRKKGAGKTIGKNRKMRAAAKTILNETPDPTPMVEFFETWFRRLIEMCHARDIRVLVVRQPWFEKAFTPEEQKLLWNFGAGRPYEKELDTYYSHAVVCDLMRRVDDAAAHIAEETGADQLDLMPVLERSFETYYDFLHFTPKGAKAVGEHVANAIVSKTEFREG
ncbi:MAG: hypothetical protein GY711_30910 [bacterium]|nr:hypothetical protein [bacterium]